MCLSYHTHYSNPLNWRRHAFLCPLHHLWDIPSFFFPPNQSTTQFVGICCNCYSCNYMFMNFTWLYITSSKTLFWIWFWKPSHNPMNENAQRNWYQDSDIICFHLFERSATKSLFTRSFALQITKVEESQRKQLKLSFNNLVFWFRSNNDSFICKRKLIGGWMLSSQNNREYDFNWLFVSWW